MTAHRRLATFVDQPAILPTDRPPPSIDLADELEEEDEIPGNVTFEEAEEARDQVSSSLTEEARKFIHPPGVLD